MGIAALGGKHAVPEQCLRGLLALKLEVSLNNNDPGEVREGKKAVDGPDKRDQKVQQLHLPKSERFLLQDASIQPPSG